MGAIGALAGLAGLGIVYWLRREARRDDWALSQAVNPRLSFLRQHTQGEVIDTTVLTWAVAALVLAVSAAFGAGVTSLMGNGPAALVLLVGCEVALVVGVVLLVALGVMRLQRRRAIFKTVRLNREAK